MLGIVDLSERYPIIFNLADFLECHRRDQDGQKVVRLTLKGGTSWTLAQDDMALIRRKLAEASGPDAEKLVELQEENNLLRGQLSSCQAECTALQGQKYDRGMLIKARDLLCGLRAGEFWANLHPAVKDRIGKANAALYRALLY